MGKKNKRNLERASAKRKCKSSVKRKRAKLKVLKAERKLINEERTDERWEKLNSAQCQQNVQNFIWEACGKPFNVSSVSHSIQTGQRYPMQIR